MNLVTFSEGTDHHCFETSSSNTLITDNYRENEIDKSVSIFADVVVKEQDLAVFKEVDYIVFRIEEFTQGRTGKDHHKTLLLKKCSNQALT